MQSTRKVQQHQQFQFTLRSDAFGEQKDIQFDSNFDSGNMARVEQNGVLQYTVHTANDCAGTVYEGYPKSWFYFSVKGFPRCIVKFVVKNLNMLWAVSKSPELYRPVCKIDQGSWMRLDKPVQIYTKENELELHFEQQFLSESQTMYFALSYPYSYQELQDKLNGMEHQLRHSHNIYFNKEILIKTPDKRNIDLIVISSHEGKQPQRAPQFNEYLFPDNNTRPFKFRKNKPIIFISARVHPGETPASHTMNGVLDFLTNSQDARAFMLRKYFVFYCIPMLNPDGVFQGHYRMDQFNQNLNRYYLNPDPESQPSCYAVRKLCDYLNEENHLIMYCDLHAHGGKKGCFFYGNAFDEFVYQVESQLLAKVLNMNCMNFDYDFCNFSRKHMSVKDRNEDLSKEGCGRVLFYKQYGLIHSYTLEMGFHSSNYVSTLSLPNNMHRKYQGHCYEEDESEANTEMYAKGPPFYTIEIYENIGKCFLISILDIYEKNPYSRIQTSEYKTIDMLRKEIATQISKMDRFRKEDGKLQIKVKKINELINEYFYHDFSKRKTFDEQPQMSIPRSIQQQPQSTSVNREVKEQVQKKFILKNLQTLKKQSINSEQEKHNKEDRLLSTHTILIQQKQMHHQQKQSITLKNVIYRQGRVNLKTSKL